MMMQDFCRQAKESAPRRQTVPDCGVIAQLASRTARSWLLAFFFCREMRVPCDGYTPGPKSNQREMRNRREMGTPQAQNPIGVISRLMFFSIFPPKNENHPSLEVPEKRIFRTRKRGLQYKSQSYFVLILSSIVLQQHSFSKCCCRHVFLVLLLLVSSSCVY